MNRFIIRFYIKEYLFKIKHFRNNTASLTLGDHIWNSIRNWILSIASRTA